MTPAEHMRQLIDEVEAELSGQTSSASTSVFVDGKKLLSEVVDKDTDVEYKNTTKY